MQNLRMEASAVKKFFSFTLLLCLASFLLAGCGEIETPPIALPTVSENAPIISVYSEDRPVTAEDMAVFNEAMEDLDGVIYEPALVATQAVIGTNYRFTATALGVYPDAEPYQVLIFIRKPPEGPAKLINIVTPTE